MAPAGRVLNVVVALLLGVGLPGPCGAPRPCASPPHPSALCLCNGDHVSCSDVPFHRFPQTDARVRHVAVGGARLGALGEAALDARELRTLVLVGSRLHHIEPRAFASMASTLASLDLGHNEFTEVPLGALRDLRALNWLNLQNNMIMELTAALDWGFLAESLGALSLSNNQLSALGAGALGALRRLAQLDLDGNRLHTVHEGALPPSVALLLLADNMLARLPCALLGRLPRLRSLHLRNNLLHAESNGSCQGGRSPLDSLDMSGNQLDDRFQLTSRGGFQLKQLTLDLNEFTSLPTFAAAAGRLRRLSISYNKVGHVSDFVVRALSGDLQRLDLDHNELDALPLSVQELSRLRHLSLAYNHFAEVHHLPPRLDSLSLAGNHLSAFPAALRGLAPASLLQLDVSYNQISAVAPDAFGPWSEALATLNLKGNRIAQLSGECFPATLPLRELMLSFNDLYRVEASAFANLTLLQALELSSALVPGEFPAAPPLRRLSWLSLDNNNIHYVPRDALANFPALEHLNLDFNQITELPSEGAAPNWPSTLKELSLAYNYIRRLHSQVFVDLLELQSLDLSYNRLQNLTEGTFASLPKLAYLNLAGNEVGFVAPGAFRHLASLEALDCHGNRLMRFTTELFEDVSNEDAALTVNMSHNWIAAVEGGGRSVLIGVLDLSHNAIETVSAAFFEAVAGSLRHLIVSFNRLTHVDGVRCGALPHLETLDAQHNRVSGMKKRFSAENATLQTVDLSHNGLWQLSPEQFHGMRRLRHLSLRANELRSLPRDSFKNTVLEHLDLSDNRLAAFPGSALAQVGFTLRRLELAANRLAYVDAAAFHAIAFLQELSLAANALTVLPDDTFAGLARLRRLDLSRNPIVADFRELFRNLSALRALLLAGCGLKAVPHVPLAELRELDLSHNRIESCRGADLRRVSGLRVLRLANNRLTSLQPAMWSGLRQLTSLDVSGNPIVRVTRASFEGLERLLALRMHDLRRLEAMEPRAFRPLSALQALELEAPPGRTGASLADAVAHTPALDTLSVHVRESELGAQLHGVRAPKLRVLEVRGAAVARVASDAFSSLGEQRAFVVRLTGTAVRALPPGLLRPLARVPHLALDVAHNRIEAIGPTTFYPNLTDWSRLATKLLPGGLSLSSNPLRCGCSVAWLGAWLRRWTAEVGGGGAAARDVARAPLCLAPQGAGAPPPPRWVPLVALAPDDAECHASALSSRAPHRRWGARLWLPLAHLAHLLAAS